jgi:glycosyltransferase involved in cell wall biosynthesis
VKIAILAPGLPPLYNGGTEIATVSIAQHAAKIHEVHVIAGATEHGDYHINGVRVHTVKSVKAPYLFGLFYIPGAVQAILKIKPDIIHAQGSQMALSAFVASKITGIPYILYGRGEIYVDWFGKNVLTSMLANGASRVIAQTRDMAAVLGRYTDKAVEVIPNGIDLDRFNTSTWAKSPHLKVAVAVGRARPEKNLFLFIDAMRYLENGLHFDHAMGVIIGDGEQLPQLKKYAEGSNVVFYGKMDNEMIPQTLKSADVLVNTSKSEGFPMAVLEAFAAGIPVVAPNVGGMPEIVSHRVNGYIYPSGDYKACAQDIHWLFTNNVLAEAMGKNNMYKVKKYSWDSVVERLYK